MPRKKGDNGLPAAKRGALIALSNHTNMSDVQIAKSQRVSRRTVSNTKKRALENDKENIDPYSNYAPQPRKGRPPAISDHDARQLIRHATLNRAQRKKSGATIARELDFNCSVSTINYAFYTRGYRRHPPTYKPALSREQRSKRKNFCQDSLKTSKYRYACVIYTDETTKSIHDVIEKYGVAYLVLDGAPAHTAWQQDKLFSIQGLTVLQWPGNSPDLNQIEPACGVDGGGGAATPKEFEKADQSKVISPWSLHHDPTQINLELLESPEDSLSGEINDMLNLPSPEGDARADSLFISPERLSLDEDGDLLLPETDHPEGNASSVPPTNTYGGTWSDITDNSPIVSATNAHLNGVATDATSQAHIMVPEISKLDALPALIEKAQDTFVQSRVEFLCGEKVVTVNLNEVNKLFSQFKQDGMLTTSNLNPIVSSFAWDAKTLVLHSSYIEVEEAQRAPKYKEPRIWPIAKTHGRIIVPSCYEEHRTLFHIDLNKHMVWRYNSAHSSLQLSKKLKEVIQHGLKKRFSGAGNDKILEYREAVGLGI
ncbi:MAG: hypothetical protein L6R37_008387 [Teloschistes peruensis]|nr:MAG: hypothetical protein L6R37_008387 [Teloschistes peruensis]